MFRFCYSLLLILFFFVNLSLNAQTTIKKTNDQWTLYVANKPFEVKGVTFGYDKDVANYKNHFEDLKNMGVNTIRLWGTNDNTLKLLEAAHSYEVKVMIGIWMRHGKPGMEADDRFNYLEDQAGMDKMYANAIDVVEKYKTHPAVLAWGIGNEVYLNTATDAEKEAYSKFLEKVCKKVKELDPNHLITSVEAWTFGIDWWTKFVPSIDIYGINCYGAGANIIPDELKKKGIDKPYIITEFGVTGEWDSPKDKNGAIIEPDDMQKYNAIANGYHDWIKSKSQCLGVYFFHYADGNDFIAPWLFTHYKGKYRPQYWAIRDAFTKQKPVNQVPKIKEFKLPEGKHKSSNWLPVTLAASDQEKESLTVSFSYNQRTGSRKRRDSIKPLLHRGSLEEGFEIQLPEENGPIKVYVNVIDTYNNLGIATTSVIVEDEKAANKKYLVPKVNLPFYVYRDGNDNPFIPSGHMGNIKAIGVDLRNTKVVYQGNASLEINYNARDNWYGVAFVDPPNDWGEMLGGYDISGAKKFSFWAKADDNGVNAKIGFGLIDKDKPFPDTAKKSIDVTLSTNWKKYSMNIKKLDLSCIRSGLVLFSSSKGFSHKIYIDEVVFE